MRLNMDHPGRPLNIYSDLCLCGSGRLLCDCCLAVRCNTTPAGSATGHAHPSCFARELRDCSTTISREHYISQSVLGLFSGSRLMVSGFPWISKGEERQVSPTSLTGKVLCKRHNEALSVLDTVAYKFFQFFTSEWTRKSKVEVYLTRGNDLERWLLKMLCGLVASGNAVLNGQRLSGWTPSREWLRILFGTKDVEFPAGLHCIVGNYRAAPKSFYAHPVFTELAGHPIALVFTVEGIGFLLAMETLPSMRESNSTGAMVKYRPMALQLCEGDLTREAHFGWPEGQVIRLRKT